MTEGLPQSQVYALLIDARGYLWLGTQGGGLARFDGRSFKRYTAKDGLQGNYVNALLQDSTGNIWIGTNRGLCRFNGRKFDFWELEKGTDVGVNALTLQAGKNGSTLLVASQNDAYALDLPASGGQAPLRPRHLAGIGSQRFGRLTAAFTDRQNRVWLGGDEGLFLLENGQWQTIQRRKAEVLAITETKDGKVLVGIFNSGVLILDGKKRNFLNTQNGLPSNKVQCFWVDKWNDKIWIGLQDAGLCIWDPSTGRVVQIAENQGLCNRNVRTVAGDAWGKVAWAGTSGGGLCKLSTQRFEHFGTDDGLRSNFVYAVCDAPNGMWFSAGDRGVSFWRKPGGSTSDTLLHFDASNGFFNVKCRAIHLDGEGRTWIGTEGLGLAVYDSRDSAQFHFFNKKNGLAGNWIRDIATDPAGNIWVATTDGGISKISPSTLPYFQAKNFGLADGLPDLTVHALHFDKKGRLWFALQTGEVGLIEQDKLRVLGKKNGLPGSMVRSLAEDQYGHLWAGTAGNGVGFAAIYFDKTLNFKQFDRLDSLASANVYLLKSDADGRLWVGTEQGVDRITLDSTGRFVRVKHYGSAEGFLGVETCQNAVTQGNDRWFGTMNGLLHFLPASDSMHGGAPVPVLTGVRLFYEPLEHSPMAQWSDNWGGLVNHAVFPHHQNHLGFEFFATDFLNQERVMYAWQLVGQEADWSPFSARTEVSYANLPPGDYRFRLRARNEDGITSEPVEVVFRIEPPFWQTWWFQLAALGSLALLVFALFKWRIRQVERKAAAEREQLEMQNRILTLEQKARQLQMNPHFIFNALNSIQSLVTAGNMDSARQYILKFGRLMRAVLDNSRQPAIPLGKEVETLRQYLEMEQFCRDGKFDFEIDTAGVESDDLQIPPMLLQPFVENAILHGIGPLSERRGKITVSMVEKNALLEVRVLDNGIGIEQSQARKDGKDTRQSAGIAVTRERLELLRQDAGFQELAVEVRQLSAGDGEVEGTEVVVRLAV